MGRINILDKGLAEMIAAGEVVERPASVVKELVENSIDAGSTIISIEIKSGGVNYIRITDNGCGIESEDVKIAFVKNATSKLKNEKDLSKIATLGFRGEALAAISSVSRLMMMTKTKEEEYGTQIEIEGGEIKKLEVCGIGQGTTIIVKDLFYNIPARLKFLKKDVSEANAISAVVERLALSHPEVAIKYIKDTKVIFHTPGDNKLVSVVHSLFGKSFTSSLVEVVGEYCGVKVTGFISKPTQSRGNRSMQFYFINNRIVKTRTAMIALEEAYKTKIMVGKFPSCFLHINLPHEVVDVNVHPAKIEVRFVNERPVFDSVYIACKNALADSDDITNIGLNPNKSFDRMSAEQYRLTPSGIMNKSNSGIEVDALEMKMFEKTVVEKGQKEQIIANDYTENSDFFKPIDRAMIDIEFEEDKLQNNQYDNRNEIYNGNQSKFSTISEKQQVDKPVERVEKQVDIDFFKEIDVENFVETVGKSNNLSTKSKIESDYQECAEQSTFFDKQFKYIGEIFQTYILAQIDNEVVIIDKHAAHEKILYNQLINREYRNQNQVLLEPLIINLSYEELDTLILNQEKIKKEGFNLEVFGENCVIIREFPSILCNNDIECIVHEMLENIKKHKNDITPTVLEELFHSIACKAAIKGNSKNDEKELSKIIELVLNDDSVRYCPHGRPICVALSKKEMEKKFGRIV